MSYLSPVAASIAGFDPFDPDRDDQLSVDRAPDRCDEDERYAHPIDVDGGSEGRAGRLEALRDRLEDRFGFENAGDERGEERCGRPDRDERWERDRSGPEMEAGWRDPIAPR